MGIVVPKTILLFLYSIVRVRISFLSGLILCVQRPICLFVNWNFTFLKRAKREMYCRAVYCFYWLCFSKHFNLIVATDCPSITKSLYLVSFELLKCVTVSVSLTQNAYVYSTPIIRRGHSPLAVFTIEVLNIEFHFKQGAWKYCFTLHGSTCSHEESAMLGITLTSHCCYSHPVAQETSGM